MVFKKKTIKRKTENSFSIFNYLASLKKHFLITTFIFLIFCMYGFFSEPPAELSNKIISLLSEIAKKFEGLNLFQTIWAIFLNNFSICLLTIILGTIFAIFPIVTLISNGFIVGFVARLAVNAQGILILWKLFPHGIFELPAILLSAAMGIKIGFELFKKRAIKTNLKNSLRVFFFIVTPLLLLAAMIEGILVFLLG